MMEIGPRGFDADVAEYDRLVRRDLRRREPRFGPRMAEARKALPDPPSLSKCQGVAHVFAGTIRLFVREGDQMLCEDCVGRVRGDRAAGSLH